MTNPTPPTPDELAAMKAREDAATEDWSEYDLPFSASSGGALFCQGCYCIEWDNEEGDRKFIAHARTDQPWLRVSLEAANAQLKKSDSRCEEIYETLGVALGYPKLSDIGWPGAKDDWGVAAGEHCAETLAKQAASKIVADKARIKRVDKALKDESRDARKVFEKLQRVSAERDGAEGRYQLADTVVQSLSKENITFKARIEELEKGLAYMADENNWDDEDNSCGILEMRRPGGRGQKGLMAYSRYLLPRCYADALLHKEDES